jgi:hypothetical protein
MPRIASVETAPYLFSTSNKPRLPTLLTNQWQNGQCTCGPVYRKVENQSQHPSIHLLVAGTWSSEHHRQHIKRPAATLDRLATLPGVYRSLYSLTVRSTSRGIAALSIRSASSHRSNGWAQLLNATPALALPAAYTMNAVPAIECTDISRFMATLIIKTQTMASLPTVYIQLKSKINNIYIGTVTTISPHRTVPHSYIMLCIHCLTLWNKVAHKSILNTEHKNNHQIHQ